MKFAEMFCELKKEVAQNKKNIEKLKKEKEMPSYKKKIKIIEFLRKLKRDEIFCKGCDRFDRYTNFPCIYKLKTDRCPKQDKFRGKYESQRMQKMYT